MSTDVNPVHWRGVHHLALVTTDMDATVRFYHGVLGRLRPCSVAENCLRGNGGGRRLRLLQSKDWFGVLR